MLTLIFTHLVAFVAGSFCALLLMAWTEDQQRETGHSDGS